VSLRPHVCTVTSVKWLVLALLLAGCASAPSTGPAPATRRGVQQPGTAPVTSRAATPPAKAFGTLDLDVQDAPLARVLESIAEAADRPIAASVSTATRVTLTLHAAPWRDALDYVVAEYHLVRRDSGRMIVIDEPPRNHLEASDASPASWFLLLARQGGFSIILPGNLPGTIDAELWNVRYEDALRATARTSGLEVEPVR